jgi:purine-binding chemotaxis protein CheW
MSELVPAAKRGGSISRQLQASDQNQYVSITIGGQLYGIPVLIVHDVLGPQRITRIPLAPPEVAGSLNLRGRIVTAIDVRLRLGLPKRDIGDDTAMSVVVEHLGEFYSLMVDAVGEVLMLSTAEFERNPATLDPRWRDVSLGIFRLDAELLIILDVLRLLDFSRNEAA